MVPLCQCGAVIRPDIVFFTERALIWTRSTARRMLSHAEVLVVAGSSVSSAACRRSSRRLLRGQQNGYHQRPTYAVRLATLIFSHRTHKMIKNSPFPEKPLHSIELPPISWTREIGAVQNTPKSDNLLKRRIHDAEIAPQSCRLSSLGV